MVYFPNCHCPMLCNILQSLQNLHCLKWDVTIGGRSGILHLVAETDYYLQTVIEVGLVAVAVVDGNSGMLQAVAEVG